jgi:hypothetical protein
MDALVSLREMAVEVKPPARSYLFFMEEEEHLLARQAHHIRIFHSSKTILQIVSASFVKLQNELSKKIIN